MKAVAKTSRRQSLRTDLPSGLPTGITTDPKTKSHAVNSLRYTDFDAVDTVGADGSVGETAREMTIEFRFEVNALLPERAYRAENYGMQ